MSYARHQTFYLRSGWLAKAIEELDRDPRLFSQKDATTRLGIGKNMVASLRFWVNAAGLTQQLPSNQGLGLTRLGSMVRKYDPFFELELTWWLIHYHIVKDEDQATSWYYLFNKFPNSDFDKITFVETIARYSGNVVSKSSYQKDYDCIVATYVPSDGEQGTPEDNTICPLTRLGLLESMRNGAVRKTSPEKLLPLEIVFLVMRDAASQDYFGNISTLVEQPCNIGKVFNLSLDSIYRYLDLLQDKGLLRFSRTASLDSITMEHENPWDLVEQVYRNLNRGVAPNEA